MSRNVVSLLSGIAITAMVVAAAGAQTRGEWRGAWGATPSPTNPLSDQFFHVEYSVAAPTAGRSEITGYVYNTYGQPAANVELKITELDASGQPITSEMRPVFGLVPAKGRAYFDVRVPTSASYQVSVQGFDFIEDGSNSHG
jgi:hypothetical protein